MNTKIIDSLDPNIKEALIHKDVLSGFISEEKYQILYLRKIAPKENDIDYKILCFLFKDKKVFLYDDLEKDFKILEKNRSIFQILKQIVFENHEIVKAFSIEIETMESHLFSRNFSKHFIDLWFDLRNELSKIDRYQARFHDVIDEIQNNKNHSHLIKQQQHIELTSTIQSSQARIKDELSRLDIIHHYYLSLKGDRLNKTIFILTLISGIFLPLNLVVGFFGMNTENLYFKNNPMGTAFVVYILSGLVILLLFFIPTFRWLNQILLNPILGRMNLYKKINYKFKKIADNLTID